MASSAHEKSSIMLDAPAGWKVRRLETFATKVGSGATPRGGQSVYLNSRVSHALIRSQYVFDRQFHRDEIAFISEEHSQELRNAEVRPDDILLNITGDGVTFARACIVPNDILPACVNQHVSIVRVDPSVCAPGYLLAYLTHPVTKRYIESFNTGGSRRAITKGHIQSFEVPLPPLPVQRRIAGILSAYDKLMENSQRRIRILEAMARALYREWFVHFRFPDFAKASSGRPGHDGNSSPAGRGKGEGRTQFVTSPLGDIPKGWEVKTVAESFEISGGGTPSRKESEYWDGGTIQWFSPSNLTGAGTMFMDDSSDHITERGLRESSARLFPSRSVMLTSRATIGAIAINTHEACTNQGFITCLPNDRVPLYFLFHWLTENVPQFVRMASGATFKEISRGVFKTIEFLQPPAKLVRQFEDAAAPMAEQALTLQRQIQNLRRTRDLLLPRLLSGQAALPHPTSPKGRGV